MGGEGITRGGVEMKEMGGKGDRHEK